MSLLKGRPARLPLMAFTDTQGYDQRLYRITDAEAVQGGAPGLSGDLPLFIADGHHRYETS